MDAPRKAPSNAPSIATRNARYVTDGRTDGDPPRPDTQPPSSVTHTTETRKMTTPETPNPENHPASLTTLPAAGRNMPERTRTYPAQFQPGREPHTRATFHALLGAAILWATEWAARKERSRRARDAERRAKLARKHARRNGR